MNNLKNELAYIPQRLQEEGINFCLVKPKEKKPFQIGWQNKKISYNDGELLEHILAGGNYGVMGGGDAKLLIVDFDNEEIQNKLSPLLPKTFTVKTGSGKLHKYFRTDKPESFKIFDKELNTLLDTQGLGKMVIGPGSIHPNGNKYGVVDDSEIAYIPHAELKALVMPYDQKADKPKIDTPKEYAKDDFIDFLKSRISIERVLSDHGVNTSRNPSNCPFHDSKGGKCLGWNGEVAHCFHCEQAWNIFSFVKDYKKISFKEALEYLAGKYGYSKELEESRKKYYDESGCEIDPNTLLKKDNTPVNKIKFLWDSEIKNYVAKETGWLVEGLIQRGGIIVLGGKRSTLKSWLAMNMCYCVANGIKFLEMFQTNKENCLYGDRENGFSGIKTRSCMIKQGLNISNDSGVIFASESYFKIDNSKDLGQIEEVIKSNNIKLFVVDVYRRVISFDENDAREVSKLFVDLLKPMCERTGVSIILIHHEKKGESSGDDMDMLRGSSDLANYVDCIIQVERKGDNLVIKQTKNRAGRELEPFQVRAKTDVNTYFKFDYIGAVEAKEDKIAKVIVTWIMNKRISEFTYTKALDYCGDLGYKKNSIINALASLQSKGIISKSSLRAPYIVSKQLSLEGFN